MTEEANSASRVVTIVQSSIPLAAATALDGVHTVQTEELPYGLGHQEKNPFSNFSEEHLNRIDDFLSTEEAQKILEQTTVDYNNSEVTGQRSLNDDDTDAPGDRSEDLLNIFDNKKDDQADLGIPFSDHAYAIPVKRVTRASVPVTSPQDPASSQGKAVSFPLIPAGSPRKRQLKEEAMIIADVGNTVEISVEESKPGKGRGRGRKNQGEVPLGNPNNRRSSRISDNEQREMADKIRKENLQKEKEEMEAMNAGQFDEAHEETPKRKGRGRPMKKQEEEESKQVGKKGKTMGSKREEDESEEEDSESEEENKEKSKKGKKGKGKAKAQESESEDESSLKGKGQKGRSKSRTKKQAKSADDESDVESPDGNKKKGKKMKGKKGSAESESEEESPKRKGKKNKDEVSDSESEEDLQRKGKGKKIKDVGKKKKGKGKNLEAKSPLKKGKKGKTKGEVEESTDTDNVKKKGKKDNPKKGRNKMDNSSDESDDEILMKNAAKKKGDKSAKKGKAAKAKNKDDVVSSSEDEPLIAMKSDKKVDEVKKIGPSKNIFDALASVGNPSSATIKRKNSETEKDTSEAKKIKIEKGREKIDSGEDKLNELRKNENDAKAPKAMKKKYRKSEDFIDMTMTELFKPDNVIRNEDDHKHEQAKTADNEEKHTDDPDFENQGRENILSNDSKEGVSKVESVPEEKKNIFDVLGEVKIESEEITDLEKVASSKDTVEDYEKEIESHVIVKGNDEKIDETLKVVEPVMVVNEIYDEKTKTVVETKSVEKPESEVEVKIPTITKEDENLKIKQMYKLNTEKDLNSSINSDVVSIAMDTSEPEAMEAIQFEATIENIDLVDLSTVEGSHAFIENVTDKSEMIEKENVDQMGDNHITTDSFDLVKEEENWSVEAKADKMPEEAETEKMKQEIKKETKTIKTQNVTPKDSSVSKVVRGRGRVVEVKSDVESSDVTGSEVEEDGRALRRKRARNPLVEEFLKKEKGKRKKAKSEDEETDKEVEEKVKKKGKEKVSKKVVETESEEEEKEESEESDEDVSSGEEYEPPDKLYCICNKPYDNKFMICCDSCENWYHGKCVGISQARGKEMEDNKEDYICDKCKEKDKIEQVKGKDKQKSESKQKPMVVKMPGLIKKDKLDKVKKVKLKLDEKKSQNGATPDKKPEPSPSATTKTTKVGNKGDTVLPKKDKSAKTQIIVKKSSEDSITSKKVVMADKTQIIVLKKGVPEVSGKTVVSGKDAATPGKLVVVGKDGKTNSTPAKGDKNTPGKTVKEDKTGGIFTPDKAKVIAQPRKSMEQKKTEDKLPRCIGPKCGKPSRPDSVYCSNECIINHSQDSLNIIHSQQEPVVKKPCKLTGDKRIVVIEKTTGKILTGDKAPTEAELCAWLEKNPSYSVLCPTMKKPKLESGGLEEDKQKDSSKLHESKHSSHHSDKDRHGEKKHHRDSSKDKKSSSSVERRKSHSDSSKDKDRKSHSHKHSDKHSSHSSSSKKDGSKSVTKAESLSSKKDGDRSEDAGPDPVRLNVRKSLRDALASRADKANDVMLSLSEIKSLALDIENELYGYFKDAGHKYKNKYRSLIFNIKDIKNKGLFRKILNGELKPPRLVRMTPDELASRELAKWREFETKHELDMIVQAEKETLKEGIHFVKKTHKGEEILDDKEDMRTLEDHGVEKSKVKNVKSEKSAVDFIGGLIGDTTSQHKNHLFDLNCRICTGKEAPPMKDTTPKKVRVAHKVRIEEPSSSDKKVTIKTAEDDKKAEDIVKEVLKAVQKAKKEQMEEEARRSKEQKHEEQIPDPSEGLADSTVVVRSPDSALQSGLEQKPDFTPKGPQVWKGFISMQDVAKFVTTAYRVSGPSDKLSIPDTIHVCGRISPDLVFDYLAKMRKVGTKDIIVLRFIPGPNEEKTSYINLYSYLNSRTRCGVVGSVSKYIKDFYILPLASHSKIPTVIRPFVEQGLERNRPHMLLAVIVRQKLKTHGAEVDVSRDPRQKNKHSSVEKTRQNEKRPYTPPGQKSYGPLPKIPKMSKSDTGSKTKSPVSATSTSTTSTVTMTTSPSTRGSSSTGDPIVDVYGAESDDGDDVEPYDPEKPTMSEVPKRVDDDAVFKKPLMPAPRLSPSSSPGAPPTKTIAGAATMIAQTMDKLKVTTSAEQANEVITEGLSPMVTITDKQKLLLELTQRVCEQKKLIELKHAGKSAQESILPLIAVANAMTAISQISKTLVTAPKRAAIVTSQQVAKEHVTPAATSVTSSAVTSPTTSTGPVTSPSITSTNCELEDKTATTVSPDLTDSDVSSTDSKRETNIETSTKTQSDSQRPAGLLPHEVAARSEKMSAMPEALKSLFSSIPGSYSHVTNYEEAVQVNAEEIIQKDLLDEDQNNSVDEQTFNEEKLVGSQSQPALKSDSSENILSSKASGQGKESHEGGKSKLFNVSLLEFDYGDSDSDADEVKAASSATPGDDNGTRPSSVMSSSSEESQDSAHIPPLQYPPLPEEPALPPPLPAEPLPPPPDHAPEDEKSEEDEEEGGKKGKKKKKKKKKDRKGKAAPTIILEAKDPISKAILDASFRRLMGQQEPITPQMAVPMSPIVGAQSVPMSDPSVQMSAMSGQIAGTPFQSPATPGIMGPVPVSVNSKPALLPTPGAMMPQATPMIAPPAAMVMPQNVMAQPQPAMQKPIPSLFDVAVKPSKNLVLSKLEVEPENELDRELRDLADADWKTNENEAQDLDLRQDQDLRPLMDIDLRPTFNIPPKIPTQVKWPEDVDHRKSGRFTPDPVFGSNIQLPSEDSDLRNFCSPLDQDYRRRDMAPKQEAEDQDFRLGNNNNRHGNRRGSHDRDHHHDRDHDRGRRRRHDESSYRKSKRRRRDDDRRHSRHDDDHDNRDKDYRKRDNDSEQKNEKDNDQDESIPKDIDQRQNEEKKVIPPPPRLADRVPVPPPQVLAQKSTGDKPGSSKLPALQPPPLPPGIEVKPFTPSGPPQKPAQPPPPGCEDW